MNPRQEHLLRLLECSFPEIQDFNQKVSATFEKLDNAKSFWSDIYVAHLQKIDGIDIDVPDTVFIKVPIISENVLKRVDKDKQHELQEKLVYFSMKENLFYKHFPHSTIPNFPFPKVYYTEDVLSEKSTGGIVAENLSDQIYEVEHVPGLNHEQVLRLMEAFAGFHSHLMKREDKSYVMDFEEGANGKEQWGVEMQKRMFDEIHNFEPLDPDFFGKNRIQNIKWSFDYDNKNRAQQKAISAFPGIICHGDMNVTNMLWKKDSPNNELAAIIDFQMVFIGSIAFDIVRILTLGLGRENRRNRTKEYLEHYYNTFRGFFNDGKVPMTFEQLSNQYKLIFPFATNFSLFGISIYIRMYKEGLLGLFEGLTFNCEVLLDRARGIVEDIEALENNSLLRPLAPATIHYTEDDYTEDVLSEKGTGGIVAENLSDQIYEVEHVPGLNHEQVLRLMEAFAGFHSHLMKREDKSYVMDFEEGAHGKEQWGVEMQKRMFDEIHNFEPLDPEFFGKDRIQNIKWSFDYENKNRAQQKAILAFPGIICHGDMNVTNMLWKKDSQNNALAAIIDFQMVFIGSIAFDIVRVLTLGLSREDRRSRTKEYLEHYYKTFCGFLNDGKVPMTFDQLSNQFKLIFPFATNFSLFGISIYIRMYKEGLLGRFDDLTFNCEELLNRARGIVEDIEALENNSV